MDCICQNLLCYCCHIHLALFAGIIIPQCRKLAISRYLISWRTLFSGDDALATVPWKERAYYSDKIGTNAHSAIASRQHPANSDAARSASLHFRPTAKRIRLAIATQHPRRNGSPIALERDLPLSFIKTRITQVRYGTIKKAYSNLNQFTRCLPAIRHVAITIPAGNRNDNHNTSVNGKQIISLLSLLTSKRKFYAATRKYFSFACYLTLRYISNWYENTCCQY